MTSRIDVWPACGRRAAVSYLSFPRLVWVCEIELSHMGKKQWKSRSGVPEIIFSPLSTIGKFWSMID